MGKFTKYEENKKKETVVNEYCVECQRETRHIIVSSYDYYDRDEDYGIVEWSNSHQIIQCQGCMILSFREVNWSSEEPIQSGQMNGFIMNNERIILYPNRSYYTLPIKNFQNITDKIRKIYNELVYCYNNELYILTAAGLRTLIEGICTELNVKDGTISIAGKDGTEKTLCSSKLAGKISGLYEQGHLTKRHADILHEYRFMGNDALHEFVCPSRDELALAIDIIEHLLETIFEIPAKGNKLKKKRANGDK